MPTQELSQMKSAPLMDLFPALEPYSSGFLSVGHGHDLYWEQSGNPDGQPIVLVHGGPGSGTSPIQRQFFDPDHYRIILFDQRGSGKSTPLGAISNNTTQDLVADMESLRQHLRIDKWILFGGSWGSALSLFYAVHHADHCKAMILRGIFLCEQGEIDWFLYGMRTIFPEAWDQFAGLFEGSDNILEDYYTALTGQDEELKTQAALRWSLYEGACALLKPNYETITTDEQKQHALTLAIMEAHYFKHEVVAPENSLLTKIDLFRHVPTVIVQGRYDIICPIKTAYKLHQLWPEADYVVVPDAGHSAFDPPLRSRLIQATENFKTL